MNAEEMIEKIRQMQIDLIHIIVVNSGDFELIKLNELPSNIYVLESRRLGTGEATVLKGYLKKSAWECIRNKRIKYKRGKKVERMEDAERI